MHNPEHEPLQLLGDLSDEQTKACTLDGIVKKPIIGRTFFVKFFKKSLRFCIFSSSIVLI